MSKKKSQNKNAGPRKVAGKSPPRKTASKKTKVAPRPSAAKKTAGKNTTTRKKSSSVTKRKTTAAASARKKTAAKKPTETKAAKKTVKKAAAPSSQKKTTPKKATPKKATAKSSPAKKAPAKKTTAKKATTGKKAVSKSPAKKTGARPSAKKKAPSQSSSATTSATKRTAKKRSDQAASTDKSSAHTPAAKPRPIAFSLDEARKIASNRAAAAKEVAKKKASAEAEAAAAKKNRHSQEPKPAARVLGAASLSDILGRNPNARTTPVEIQKKEVPKKFLRYYKLLLELREHVLSELDLHTKDTLKRSSKEDSGNLSGYGQHMADAGTDSFDRDFALSLVSTEQEALSEIEAAIERIHNGTYGTCEITGKPIAKERLLAVPFARYSVEGQAEYEKNLKRPSQRGGAYLDSGSEGGDFLTEDPDE